MKNKLITIGIPTYEAGQSLVVTLRSIYNQSAINNVSEIIVAVDGNPIKDIILKQIVHPKLKVKYFKKRMGQAQRINDICRLSSTDILILTNDDMVLSIDAVKNVITQHGNFDLLTSNLKVLKPNSSFEKALQRGVFINNYIFTNWNDGDNYLSCNGRFIAMSRKFYKKLSIPVKIWNNDAYVYLFAKLNKYKVVYGSNVIAYFKLPSNISEHVKQSIKFQSSKKDNQRYLSQKIDEFYKVPFSLKFRAFINEFRDSYQESSQYLIVYIYSRLILYTNNIKLSRDGFWETDKSTKNINLNV